MKTVKIKDKEFGLFLPQQVIEEAIDTVAEKIKDDLSDSNPLFVSILNGSFMFASELMKRVNFPSELTFVKLSSYEGLGTTGDVKKVIGLTEDIKNRTIVIIEDIIDTGNTIDSVVKELQKEEPKEIKIATLLFKPKAMVKQVDLDYVALEIPNDFIVGYGLDYDGYGRNFPEIYKIKS